MSSAEDRAHLMGYPEAALRLGLTAGSIKQFVYRGQLHAIELPSDQHKYLLRAEVEWYDRKRRGLATEPNPYHLWAASNVLAASPELAPVGNLAAFIADGSAGRVAATLVLLGLLLLLLNSARDRTTRVIAIGAIGMLGLLAVAELYRERMVSAAEKRRLEKLARTLTKSADAEGADPESFVNELRQLLPDPAA